MLLKDLPQAESLRALNERYEDADLSSLVPYLGLLHVAREISSGVEANLAKHGLSHGRLMVLILLWHSPRDQGATPAEIADHAVVTRATISGLLDALEKDGLVERVNRTDDRRMVSVRLTPAGDALLDRALPYHYKRVGAMMQSLTKAERKTLSALLGKLRGGLPALRAGG
jgi:DNA-binding MarR family transcriptional regulator